MAMSGAVELTAKLVYSNAIVVEWRAHPNTTLYEAAASRADGRPGSAAGASGINATRYALTGLEPSTAYTISVGAAGGGNGSGSGSAPAAFPINVTTLPAAGASLPAALLLDASLRPHSGMVDLAWLDLNGAGDGRIRVEVSVDGGPFERAPHLRALSDSSAEIPVLPEWMGRTLAYRALEWLGPQALYSANATVRVPAALDAPQGLAVRPAGDGSAGAGAAAGGGSSSILLGWDHSPLFRNYIVEALDPATGSWEQAASTSGNTAAVTLPLPPPGGAGAGGALGLRVSAMLGPVISPPSEVLWLAVGPGAAGGGR